VYNNTHLNSIRKPSCWYLFGRPLGSNEIPHRLIQPHLKVIAVIECEKHSRGKQEISLHGNRLEEWATTKGPRRDQQK
jgi:hypothetical protein